MEKWLNGQSQLLKKVTKGRRCNYVTLSASVPFKERCKFLYPILLYPLVSCRKGTAQDGVILAGSPTWIGKGRGGASEGAPELRSHFYNSDLRPLTAAGLLTVSVLVHGVNRSHHF